MEMLSTLRRSAAIALLTAAVLASSPALALEPGSDGGSSGGSSDQAAQAADKAAQAADKAAQDLAKVAEQAARDQQRYLDEKAKIQADAAKDPAKAQQDLVKLDADQQKWEAQRAEETAKIQSDLAEEQAKILSDMTEDAQRSEDRSGSSQLQDLAAAENPDRDGRGFPVRRDEVSALDLDVRAAEAARARGFRVIETIPLEELGRSVVRLAVPPGMTEAEAVRQLHQLDPRAIVDFTHYYGMLPAGEQVEGVSAGERLSRKSGRLRVGMIDTAIARHPFLRSSKIRARAFGHAPAPSAAGHGTAVASILVSEGTRDLIAADVFRGDSSATLFTSADAIAESLEWLAREKVPVINISLAGPRNAILDTMLLRAIGSGMTVVASAGNGGPAAPPAYPAALRQVVAVTAVDQADRVYRYANQGLYINVAAPGVRELGAAASGGFRLFSGTSFAAPHISAWLARCLDSKRATSLEKVARCRHDMVLAARDRGPPGRDPIYGYGVIR